MGPQLPACPAVSESESEYPITLSQLPGQNTAEPRQADQTNMLILGGKYGPRLFHPVSVLSASEESCALNRARFCVVLHTVYSLRSLSSSSQQE